MTGASKSQVTFLGIRHHGPGSARNVRAALQSLTPDCILIELPEQCSVRLRDVADQGLVPPVALLLYNPKDLREAAFYPFAEFSPEWQAMQYASSHHIEVRAIDLPFSYAPTANSTTETTLFQPDTDPDSSASVVADPFSAIAQLDGFSDCERWWETRVERQITDPQEIFRTIGDLMEALRAAKSTPESDETLLREAYMRQGIRQAIADGFKQIAVICGAWHVPALRVENKTTAKQDALLLKTKRKSKTETTWIPWSFERLTIAKGYQAGVRTPMWYRYLHTYGAQDATSYWVSEVCSKLRSSDIMASSAHAIETIRLAQTLSVLRGTSIPGIDELTEATVSVLCHGNETIFLPARHAMLVGDVIGTVPSKLNQNPLRADFESRLSGAHMKLTSTATKVSLDMRNQNHVKKSVLIHQLLLLNIGWGRPEAREWNNRLGGFHEDWILEWQPEFELRWLELSALGATVLQATETAVLRQIEQTKTLTTLVQLLSNVMKAELLHLLPLLSSKLRSISASTSDTFTLADAALPLAEMSRYGSARNFDFTQLQPILDDLITRACIQMVVACSGLDEITDAEAAVSMSKLNRAVHLPSQQSHKPQWYTCLIAMIRSESTAPKCSGLAHRLLFDASQIEMDQISNALLITVSVGQEPYRGALWLDGFLQGNALLILHYQPFFEALRYWINSIQEDAFEQSLPVLRRAFSTFSEPERAQIMRLVMSYESPKSPSSPEPTLQPEQVQEVRNAHGWIF